MSDQTVLVENENRKSILFEALFNAGPNGLVILDMATKTIKDANPIAMEILGLSKEDILGETIKICEIKECHKNCPFHGDSPKSVSGQLNLCKSDGTELPVMFSTTCMEGDQEGLAVFSFLDISERMADEERLRQNHEQLKSQKDVIVQSEKLASIGQLAAGVAHEINNPVGYVTSNLGTISEYVDTLKTIVTMYRDLQKLDDSEPEKKEALLSAIKKIEEDEDLDFIFEDSDNVMKESMEGAHRVGEIVQNLKSFAREDGDARVPQNINEGIESMIKMVWNELKYKCTVERNFTEVPVVQCHKGQVNQVIMNILVNASHAMPDSGGVITVSTGVKDGMLEVKIADNGSGIPEDILPRIFDPFYTTKEVGKGTGLGLSISHGIILDHEGRIEVDSEVGVGTEFRIYLPLADCVSDSLIG